MPWLNRRARDVRVSNHSPEKKQWEYESRLSVQKCILSFFSRLRKWASENGSDIATYEIYLCYPFGQVIVFRNKRKEGKEWIWEGGRTINVSAGRRQTLRFFRRLRMRKRRRGNRVILCVEMLLDIKSEEGRDLRIKKGEGGRIKSVSELGQETLVIGTCRRGRILKKMFSKKFLKLFDSFSNIMYVDWINRFSLLINHLIKNSSSLLKWDRVLVSLHTSPQPIGERETWRIFHRSPLQCLHFIDYFRVSWLATRLFYGRSRQRWCRDRAPDPDWVRAGKVLMSASLKWTCNKDMPFFIAFRFLQPQRKIPQDEPFSF